MFHLSISVRHRLTGRSTHEYSLYHTLLQISSSNTNSLGIWWFLAALQPYKAVCPRWWVVWVWECKNIFQFFSLVMKTKLVQNVNRMSEWQNDIPKDSVSLLGRGGPMVRHSFKDRQFSGSHCFYCHYITDKSHNNTGIRNWYTLVRLSDQPIWNLWTPNPVFWLSICTPGIASIVLRCRQ